MNKRIYIPILIVGTYLLLMFVTIPASEAHVLVVGDPHNNRPTYYQEAHATAQYLKSHGYQVKELYKENATSKNVLKGMYNADAIIYVSQGASGSMNTKTFISKGPYGLITADKPIIGFDTKIRLGSSGPYITPPFKKSGIPVIISHACYSSGQTNYYNPNLGVTEIVDVKNRAETVYNFSRMFTAWNANYLATGGNPIAYGDYLLISNFVGGKPLGTTLDNMVGGYCDPYDLVNGVKVWARYGDNVLATPPSSRVTLYTIPIPPNIHYTVNPNDPRYPTRYGRFPTAAETTPYDDAAAEKWYNSLFGLPSANAGVDQTVYAGVLVALDGSRSSPGKEITNYYWKIINKPAGSAASLSGTSLLYPKFKADKSGDYTVQLTVKSEKGISDPDTVKITAIIPTIKFDESTYTNIKGAAQVTVTDEVANKNKNSKDKITVNIRSFRTENGNTKNPALQEISLVLTETGANTGIFRGAFVFDTAKPTRKDGIYVMGTASYDHVEGNEWISKSSVNMPETIPTWVSKDYFMAPGIFQAAYTPEKKSFTKEAKYSFSSNIQGEVNEIVTEKLLNKLTTKPNPLFGADVWLIPKGKKTACAHTTTNAIAYYRFTNIKPGNYYISVYAKSTGWVPYTYETEKQLEPGKNTQNFPPDEIPQLSQEAFDAIKKVIGDFDDMKIEYSAWMGGAGLGCHSFSIITAVVTKNPLKLSTAFLGLIITVAGEEYIAWKYKSEAQKFLNDLYNQMIIKPKLSETP